MEAGNRRCNWTLHVSEIFTGRHSCNVSYDETRDRLAPLVDEVAARARNSGQLRADVTGTDLIFIQVALSSVAAVAQDGHQPADRSDTSELYRRYLWITLDGLRAGQDPSPLPVPRTAACSGRCASTSTDARSSSTTNRSC